MEKIKNEDLSDITSLGVVNEEEARYYISCLRTAGRIINKSGIDLLKTPDELIAVVFLKITKNLFWIRERWGKEEELEKDEEKETEVETEKNNIPDIPVMPDEVVGISLEVANIRYDKENNIFLIGTDHRKISTRSKVLAGQVERLQVQGKLPARGVIEKKKSGDGREYFSFHAEPHREEI